MRALSYATTFGAIDADNDDLLLQCFEDHEAYIATCTNRGLDNHGRPA
jgi:hypothetical protein